MSNFNLESLKSLLYDFHNLTNIKTCLYDSEGNELCYYPTKLSAFCELLRETETIDKRCQDCDKSAFAMCRKMRSQYVYTCHAGLQECVSPIIYEDRIIGFIMIGQIKNKNENDFFNIQKELPYDLREKLSIAYDKLPSISNDKLLSAFRILDACANYDLLKTLMHVYKDSIDAQIDKYIRKNLSSPLSVSDLCSEFHLSRYEIYNICNRYFGCTPAEYIKKCRLTHACRLLETTKLSINEIAVECGIEDYNYFSKVFKSTYGLSPTSYRKKYHVNSVSKTNK